jgi:hypothetical protein
MPIEPEPVSFCQILLEFFNSRIHYLDVDAALLTDKMVMMLVSQLLLISNNSIAKVHQTGKASIYQKLHRSVDGGLTYGGIVSLDKVVQLLRG